MGAKFDSFVQRHEVVAALYLAVKVIFGGCRPFMHELRLAESSPRGSLASGCSEDVPVSFFFGIPTEPWERSLFLCIFFQ